MLHFRHTQTKDPQIIAVCGVSHGSGTTHFALALANFLCSKENRTAAYLEYNATREISGILPQKRARLYGVDCFSEVLPGALPEILQMRYSYFILDMGVLNSGTYLEFLRCGSRFVIGSVAPWKQQEYRAFIKAFHLNNMMDQENITFLGNLGIKENQKLLMREFQTAVPLVPFLPNPFQLTPEDWLFFEELLEDSDIPHTSGKSRKYPRRRFFRKGR